MHMTMHYVTCSSTKVTAECITHASTGQCCNLTWLMLNEHGLDSSITSTYSPFFEASLYFLHPTQEENDGKKAMLVVH